MALLHEGRRIAFNKAETGAIARKLTRHDLGTMLSMLQPLRDGASAPLLRSGSVLLTRRPGSDVKKRWPALALSRWSLVSRTCSSSTARARAPAS